MSARPRYVLHIGYGKTGTSQLQRFLAFNRQGLRNTGILYPDIAVRGAPLHALDHNMMGRALAGRTGWWGFGPTAFVEQFEGQRRQAGAGAVLLSAETFLGGVQPWDFDDAASYRTAADEAVETLGGLLAFADVEIFVYLRRQDLWLESVMNQNIKVGGLVGPWLSGLSPEEAASVYAPRLDYRATLARWERVFGRDALCVGVYERGQLRDDDIVADFAARVGLPIEALSVPARSDGANRRLPTGLLEVKRMLNREGRPKYAERALNEAMIRVAEDVDERGFPARSLLPHAMAKLLVERYDEGNSEIAERYLGRADGVLFADPPPAPETDICDPALEGEVVVEVLARLDREQRSAHGRLRLLRHWTAEVLRRRLPFLHGVARQFRVLARRRAART